MDASSARSAALDQAHQSQGESRGIVMVSVVRIHDIVESERRPAPGGGRPAEAHPLARPCARHSRTELVVREDHVDDAWRCVPLKNIEMVGQVEARRLAGLRRDVADEDSERGRGQDRVADLGQ